MDTVSLATFLKKEFLPLLHSIPEEAAPVFGKMNPRQMTEHLLESLNQSNGTLRVAVITPEEKLPGLKTFLLSDKSFRPETAHPLLPKLPSPPQLPSYDAAKEGVEIALYGFFERFSSREHETENHQVFGPLNYEEWVIMHYKHLTHHLRQFAALPAGN
jgi:oxepin-CoA hydrolase/3-oxo-5,6-dehydrosuberyl-CoA semialdehyde dehydrogenase